MKIHSKYFFFLLVDPCSSHLFFYAFAKIAKLRIWPSDKSPTSVTSYANSAVSCIEWEPTTSKIVLTSLILIHTFVASSHPLFLLFFGGLGRLGVSYFSVEGDDKVRLSFLLIRFMLILVCSF